MNGPVDVASSKENIGLLFKATNKKEEAKNLFLEAAAIRRKMLGPAHHLTQKSERLAAECEEEVLRDTLFNNMAKLKVEDASTFQEATQEVLQSRKIVKARRRSLQRSKEEINKAGGGAADGEPLNAKP